MERIISGIQATGNIHLGNYLGNIQNLVKLQSQYQTFVFVADLHSVTIPQDPINLRISARNVVAVYMASGIDQENVSIFIQSQIPFHSELAWLFSCITPVGWLNRMTQFKDKAGEDKEKASSGLYTYPILMAADILLYKADLIPVGNDQKQHLELTRNIAEAFNRKFNIQYFKLPKPYIGKEEARIMSLRDGTIKMSKSDSSDFSRINLSDTVDQIAKKIQKSKTDSYQFISYDKELRPEITNLLNIYSVLSNKSVEELIKNFEGKTSAYFKKELIDLLISKIGPIGVKIKLLLDDPQYIDEILLKGKEKVYSIAEQTLKEIKEMFGFLI